MDDIFYLVHTTNNPDCLKWDELRISGNRTGDQFPGVYFSLITKWNIDKESIFPGKFALIFSKKLLLQKNYHMNIQDYNGIINENNTYYPWELSKYVKKIKDSDKSGMNEVVFHDPISMKYCCGILQLTNTPLLGLRLKDCLPKKPLVTSEEPDMKKTPFYCYPYEDEYTGVNPVQGSSESWYRMMANVCRIKTDPGDTKEKIVQKFKKGSKKIYKKRGTQKVQLLRKYTRRAGGAHPKKIDAPSPHN